MSNNLTPGVRVTESTQGLSVPQSNQVIIGIIGTSEKGTENTIYRISSEAEADLIFGNKYSYGANLVPMIRRAFQQGASIIKAISIGTPELAAATANTEGVLTADSLKGSTVITVNDATIYNTGDIVYLGPDATYEKEEKLEVASASGSTVTLTTALQFDHYTGENLKIVIPKEDTDYIEAITKMEADLDKNIVVCESNSNTILSALNTMAQNSTEKYNTPCIAVGSAVNSDTEATIIAKGATLNNDRFILGYPLLVDYNGKIITEGENAATIAGVIAGQGLPKLNLNGSIISGFQGVNAGLTDSDALIIGGISPIEVKYGSIHFIKIVTTKATSNGIPDQTWREASVRLNVDVIEKTIIQNIRAIYMQKGNTPEVRESIKQKIISMLEIFANQNVIVADEVTGTPAFKSPVVTTDVTDNTKVNVDIQISPAKPLNFIQLNFKISI